LETGEQYYALEKIQEFMAVDFCFMYSIRYKFHECFDIGKKHITILTGRFFKDVYLGVFFANFICACFFSERIPFWHYVRQNKKA
jgi:hypothetical protein